MWRRPGRGGDIASISSEGVNESETPRLKGRPHSNAGKVEGGGITGFGGSEAERVNASELRTS